MSLCSPKYWFAFVFVSLSLSFGLCVCVAEESFWMLRKRMLCSLLVAISGLTILIGKVHFLFSFSPCFFV